jgi:hypothetical protein
MPKVVRNSYVNLGVDNPKLSKIWEHSETKKRRSVTPHLDVRNIFGLSLISEFRYSLCIHFHVCSSLCIFSYGSLSP